MKPLIAFVFCCVVLGVATCSPYLIHRVAPNSWLYSKRYSEAACIISKIEKYKVDHNVYPHDLSVLGIKYDDNGPYYYDLREDGTFRIWFSGGKSFFACQTYNSATRDWYESD